ncbi:DUF1302 family protein [uncultured Paraglaciecola sp.]|uniref:DUF1302 family protein n=1 Tax=uncultured Paraglaciecola sp. TaxID=1765024 RepID=UPI0025DB5626|nr:DUF1302 family protein [uncultured Paraglaciecola sp.]
MIKSLLSASLITLMSSSIHAELSATWEQEFALSVSGGDTHAQKLESIFQPEWNTSLTDNIDMTVIGRMLLDAYDNLGFENASFDNFSDINGTITQSKHADISIREWYVDTEISNTFWRIGKQQVVWGQADGLKVLDVVNPQSYREFILDDFADSRIPLWMLNVEVPIGDNDSVQFLWIADLTYNELATQGSVYELSSPLFIPQSTDGIKLLGINQHRPSSAIKDADIGIRYSKFYAGWDLTFNYMYHYQDNPVMYQTLVENNLTINAQFERNNLLGASASKAFGDFTLRTEIAYSSDTYHLLDKSSAVFIQKQGIHQSDDVSSVLGLDWQGLENTMLSIQWFQSSLFNYEPSVIRPQHNHILSGLYKQSFENETWELEILALYGLDKRDTALQIHLSYMLESNIKLWVGTDVFSGPEKSLFGQFNQTDRLTLGLEWGF